MLDRFVAWLGNKVSIRQAVIVLAFCMLLAGAFAFGAAMGQHGVGFGGPRWGPPVGDPRPDELPQRGTFGAIDRIEGDVIQMRDPRSGRTWRVRTGDDTVIEAGARRRIPFDNLRVGQRIFVVGVPNEVESGNEFDAQFIGVVLGQQQRYVRPVMPVECRDCTD